MVDFDNELLDIHKQIAIRNEDRRPFTGMYEDIRDWLMTKMCAVDPLFKEMFKGTQLFGSYPNNVRIIQPSEFDVIIKLELPMRFRVVPQSECPGFIEIHSESCNYIRNRNLKYQTRQMFNGLRAYNSPTLLLKKFQDWIEDVITRVLDECAPPPGYSLKYKRCNVAQQFRVEKIGARRKYFSIDFVPAIILPKDVIKRLVKKSCKGLKAEYLNTFFALPKRLRGCGSRTSKRYSFQLVNPEAERDIMWNKQNLKIVYRLLKSLKKHLQLRRLKSYFLTAIFLFEIDEKDELFWHKPVGEILLHMLDVLIEYFKDEFLPFYWAPRYNILDIMRSEEMDLYESKLIEAFNRLRKLSLNMPVSYNVASNFQIRAD